MTDGGTRDGGAPLHVLLVDDHDDTRHVYRSILRSRGFEVTTASDGAEALDLIAARVPDVVATEVVMPRVDGVQLLRALRASARTAGVPVVAIFNPASAPAPGELRGRFDALLPKPVDPEELTDLLRRVVVRGRSAGPGATTPEAPKAGA